MKRFYTILGCITLAINAYAQQVPDADPDFEWTENTPWTSTRSEQTMTESSKYKGKVTIDMDEERVEQEAMVEIIPTNDNSCTFVLPNFALGELEVGDIVVPEVTISHIDGVNHYKGAVKNMSLLDNAIHADVDLSGTIDADGKAHMDVNVLWKESNLPIVVEFDGTLYKGSGIKNTLDTLNAPVEYYNLSGVRVSNPQNGIFIRRQGGKATKVVIK